MEVVVVLAVLMTVIYFPAVMVIGMGMLAVIMAPVVGLVLALGAAEDAIAKPLPFIKSSWFWPVAWVAFLAACFLLEGQL